ncbi:MAG: hypothetical protein KAJ10_00500 [Thermodesulfovibrionia bacterium]|nr:hypothetical protein [Thermodesulfovibrionia bacterium]
MNLHRVVNITIILLFIYLFSPYVSFAHDMIFPGEKLKTLYPEAISFEQKNLYISDQQSTRIEDKIKVSLPEEDLKPSIYFAITKQTDDAPPRKVAVIIFIDAYGDGGKVEIGVVVGRKGELMKILLFENNESAILGTQSFLKQYEGKKPSDVFEVDRDIKAPSGEEKTAQAIASGARRGLLIINELLSKK